ncbi:MAG: hypothetical protein J7K23_01900 [Thermoproteales archaeon]|nr:hypothetical protein [Thermoproteales archaeon]
MSPKPKIGLIFSAVPSETKTWPYVGYDYESRAKKLYDIISKELSEIDFIGEIVYHREDIENVLNKLGNVDGYVIYYLGIWLGITENVIKRGKPTILIDDLYAGSGEFLIEYGKLRRKGYKNVIAIASSNIRDVLKTIRLLWVLYKLKNSRIVVVTDRKKLWGMSQEELKEKIRKDYGLELIFYNSEIINKLYENVDDSEADRWKRKWMNEASRIVEVREEDIFKAAKLYIVLRDILKKENADAITVDCLTLVYGAKIPAYPCLGFFQLNNDGLTGTCEADIDSTVTMLLARYLTDRPSFVSDPVIDLASNQIIYAHCVAASKVYGSDTISMPYEIWTHAEDRSGASIRVLFPLGEKVTTVKINMDKRAMSIHSGVSVANVEEEKACRTKLAVQANAYRILENWNLKHDFSWHRVTVIGDYRREFINIAKLLGLDVVEEDT